MFGKKLYLLTIIVSLFTLFPVNAVTVSCGEYAGFGNYRFTNVDNGDVEVTIDTGLSNIQVLPENPFTLSPGESKIISLRSQYGDTYLKLFVTYKELYNGGNSASLECPFYATQSDHPVVTTTTTTTLPSDNCSDKGFLACNSMENCEWVGDFRFGYCRTKTTSTTTTSTTTTSTTTTIPQTTTTTSTTTTTTLPSDNCSGKTYLICNFMSNCEWIGNMHFGYCRERGETTTTTTTSTTTTTIVGEETTTTTTTTICEPRCIKWFRAECIEWEFC